MCAVGCHNHCQGLVTARTSHLIEINKFHIPEGNSQIYLCITAHKGPFKDIFSSVSLFSNKIQFSLKKEVCKAIYPWKLINQFLFHVCIHHESYTPHTPCNRKSELEFLTSTEHNLMLNQLLHVQNSHCYKTFEFHKLNFMETPRSIYSFDTEISDGSLLYF